MAGTRAEATASSPLRYVDIGINLTDPVFRGRYHGKQAHEDDFEEVLARARRAGVAKLIVTGSDVEQSREAIALARRYPGLCYATIGVHPCSASAFDTHPDRDAGVLADLAALIADARRTPPPPPATPDPSAAAVAPQPQPHTPHAPLAAIGEFGLDYDRLPLCPAATQRRAFAAQLAALAHVYPDAAEPPPPLFLHSRAAHADFVAALRPHLDRLPRRGVVHSFTGSSAEAAELLDLGFAIGVNGCSVKTEDGLAVVRTVPLGRILLETDGPWCEVRPSSAGAALLGDAGIGLPLDAVKAVKKERFVRGAIVKGRNEPCAIGVVARVVAAAKGVSVQEVAETCWANSVRMFGLGEEA